MIFIVIPHLLLKFLIVKFKKNVDLRIGKVLILYKYYGFNSGESALESERLGFRTPTHFNDPFEASEPYRVCRRVNILRDYPDDKIKIYP